MDKRGLPLPNSNPATGMIRYILRRGSSHAPPAPVMQSPGSLEAEAVDLSGGEPSPTIAPTPIVTEVAPKIEPVYGDRPDQGDEVRFSVEVTRIDRLDDLLSLDIRRLKGHLKSYKFLYDLIRE